MTTDRVLKEQIAGNLRDMGFSVDLLEERAGLRTPDLLVAKAERYAIEVKEKIDDPAMMAEERAILDQGMIADRHEYWGPKNTVARIVESAARQLRAWPEDQRDFSLVWLHAAGEDAESQWEQFWGTLYGTTSIIELGRSTMRQCFYFHESAFFRFRDVLDGAIASNRDRAGVWLNTYSPRAEPLRNSELAAAFGGIFDPREAERDEEAMIADCEIDRRDEAAVKQYLQRKYGTRPLDHMHVGRLTAFFSGGA